MEKILITGGCGFIGSNLAIAFSEYGHHVTCLDNLSRRGSEILMKRVQDAGCTFIHGDIRNQEDFSKCDDADIMIECSAEPSVLVGSKGSDARFMINNNLTGALNCFEWARERSCGVIFLSTSRVYPYNVIGNANFREDETRFVYDDHIPGISSTGVSVNCPLDGIRSLYGATKLAAEYILKEYAFNYNMPAIVNRCGVIAGPWQLGKVDQGVFTYWLVNHYFKKPLQYIGYGGKGKQVRDLIHIEDLVRLILIQVERLNDFRGEIFNVGGGIDFSLSLLETTKICRQLTGTVLKIDPVLEERPADLPWFITDNGVTEDVFKWSPAKKPEDIFNDIYNWLQNNDQILSSFF